eukprot:2087299-Karenia_brevis.AAC.1
MLRPVATSSRLYLDSGTPDLALLSPLGIRESNVLSSLCSPVLLSTFILLDGEELLGPFPFPFLLLAWPA